MDGTLRRLNEWRSNSNQNLISNRAGQNWFVSIFNYRHQWSVSMMFSSKQAKQVSSGQAVALDSPGWLLWRFQNNSLRPKIAKLIHSIHPPPLALAITYYFWAALDWTILNWARLSWEERISILNININLINTNGLARWTNDRPTDRPTDRTEPSRTKLCK